MDLLRHLRCFVAVAEELHFGRAALRLHMAQPPLSQRIRALEEVLGARLLERTSRRVALTPAGEELLPEARALLARADALPDLVAEATGTAGRPRLRVAVAQDLPAEVIAAVARGFEAASPDVRLELHPATLAEVRSGFGAGELHAAIVRRSADVPGAQVALTLTSRLGAVLADEDPLVAQSDVAPAELGDRALVRSPGDDELVAGLAAHGWEPTRTSPAPDPAWARALLLAGGAVALAERPPSTPQGVVWRPVAAPLVCRCSVLVADPPARGTAELTAVAEHALVEVGGWTPPSPRRGSPPEGLLA